MSTSGADGRHDRPSLRRRRAHHVSTDKVERTCVERPSEAREIGKSEVEHAASRYLGTPNALAGLLAACVSASVVVAALVYFPLFFENPPGQWLVGVSRTEISPTAPVWLSGFASRTRAPTEEEVSASDPLYVTALALRPAGNASALLVLVTLDVIGADASFSDALFDRLRSELELERRQVRLCYSHTHSGPVVGRNLFPLAPDDEEQDELGRRYAARLEQLVVDTVRQALVPEHTRRVVANFGVGQAPLAVNRRQVQEPAYDGKRRGDTPDRVPVMWFELTEPGASRPRFSSLFFRRRPWWPQSKPAVFAGVFGYSAHASMITTGYSYSGDYPRYACDFLEEEGGKGPGGVWLYVAGVGGDQNIYPRGMVQDAKQAGRVLASSVARLVDDRRGMPHGALRRSVIAAVHEFIPLAFRTRLSLRELRRRFRKGDIYTKRMAQAWTEKLSASGEKMTPRSYARFPVAVWRIGDIRIAFLGGEPTSSYIRLVLDRSSSIDWVVGYCDDVVGYVASADLLRSGLDREGSDRSAIYYGLPSAWHPSVEHSLVEKVYHLVKKLDLVR